MSDAVSRSNGGTGQPLVRIVRIAVIAILLIAGALFIAWRNGIMSSAAGGRPQNAIMVISPYRYQGTWVFDDASAGLVREPFVAGIPEMIDHLVSDIPNAESGFRLHFLGWRRRHHKRRAEHRLVAEHTKRQRLCSQ